MLYTQEQYYLDALQKQGRIKIQKQNFEFLERSLSFIAILPAVNQIMWPKIKGKRGKDTKGKRAGQRHNLSKAVLSSEQLS